MMHQRRVHCLHTVPTTEELARMLTEKTWTLCSAFVVAGHEDYAFLNDATHEDGAGEYAVIKKLPDGRCHQVESITFSWCDQKKAQLYIDNSVDGWFDQADFVFQVKPTLQMPEQHGRCHLCA